MVIDISTVISIISISLSLITFFVVFFYTKKKDTIVFGFDFYRHLNDVISKVAKLKSKKIKDEHWQVLEAIEFFCFCVNNNYFTDKKLIGFYRDPITDIYNDLYLPNKKRFKTRDTDFKELDNFVEGSANNYAVLKNIPFFDFIIYCVTVFWNSVIVGLLYLFSLFGLAFIWANLFPIVPSITFYIIYAVLVILTSILIVYKVRITDKTKIMEKIDSVRYLLQVYLSVSLFFFGVGIAVTLLPNKVELVVKIMNITYALGFLFGLICILYFGYLFMLQKKKVIFMTNNKQTGDIGEKS